MAAITTRGSSTQIRVRHRLLPAPFFATFSTREEAIRYADRLEGLLDQGVVPVEIAQRAEAAAAEKKPAPTLARVVLDYMGGHSLAPSDTRVLEIVIGDPLVASVNLDQMNLEWVTRYLTYLKVERNNTPGTIRKRIQALARAVDYHLLGQHDGMAQRNILRELPRGYSTYSPDDAKRAAAAGGMEKRDVRRSFRLAPGDEAAVLSALAGAKRPDRERGIAPDHEFTMLFRLIIDTGLRLREAYTLTVDRVDLPAKVIRVAGTKGHRGALKPRITPIKPALHGLLTDYLAGRSGLLFPGLWSGDPSSKALTNTSNRLSSRFKTLFQCAGLDQPLTEHDLRHEACCRWVELRNRSGGWIYSLPHVCAIMGWSSMNMILTYASLRGEDLVGELWEGVGVLPTPVHKDQ